MLLVPGLRLMDNVADIIIALDGNGGAEAYADYSQWEEDRKKTEQKSVSKSVKEKPEQIKNKGKKPQQKKISYKDRLEFEKMPLMIEEAEDLVRDLEEKVLQPGVVSDPAVLADVCSIETRP